jgi:phosphoribosylformylglycinamidine cyclo-ligase
MCHITGGGLPENLPRVTPDGLGIVIQTGKWAPDPLFGLIQERGKIDDSEMLRTFNMGVGFTMVVAPDRTSGLIEALIASGEDAFLLGQVAQGEGVTFRA